MYRSLFSFDILLKSYSSCLSRSSPTTPVNFLSTFFAFLFPILFLFYPSFISPTPTRSSSPLYSSHILLFRRPKFTSFPFVTPFLPLLVHFLPFHHEVFVRNKKNPQLNNSPTKYTRKFNNKQIWNKKKDANKMNKLYKCKVIKVLAITSLIKHSVTSLDSRINTSTNSASLQI